MTVFYDRVYSFDHFVIVIGIFQAILFTAGFDKKLDIEDNRLRTEFFMLIGSDHHISTDIFYDDMTAISQGRISVPGHLRCFPQ